MNDTITPEIAEQLYAGCFPKASDWLRDTKAVLEHRSRFSPINEDERDVWRHFANFAETAVPYVESLHPDTVIDCTVLRLALPAVSGASDAKQL